MLTRSQTANKNCKVEKVSTKKTTALRTRSYNNASNFIIPLSSRASSYVDRSNVVEQLQNNKNVSSIVTRSKINKEVNIDFDGASREWRRNKRSVGNGSFVYK